MTKAKATFLSLIVAVAGIGVGVSVAPDGGGDAIEYTFNGDDVQRVWRDYCEARRKDAQDAGDDEERQYWLAQRRLAETGISLRELWSDLRPGASIDPTPNPDPGPGVDYTPPPVKEEHVSAMAGDAPVGTTGTIGWSRQGDKVVAFTSARMQGGDMYAVIQVLDTTVDGWKLIKGNSVQSSGDELTDTSILLWFEPTPGVEYEVQTWVVLPEGSKGPQADSRVLVEP